MRAKREFLKNAIAPGFYRNHDEDIKTICISPIESLFSNMKHDQKGTGMSQLYLEGVPIFRRVMIIMIKMIKVGLERTKL